MPQNVKPRKPGGSGLWLVGLLVVAIGGLVVARLASNGPSSTGAPPSADARLIDTPISSRLAASVTSLPPVALPNQGWAKPTTLTGTALTSGGKPVVLYMGANYCPYCAAERWTLVVALSRFGTFGHLRYMESSSTDVFPNTRTFTFYGSTYASPYLVFRPVEMQGRVLTNGTYPPLQRPTGEEANFYLQHNAKGVIPFVTVAGKYLWLGAPFSPSLLQGLSWTAIADDLHRPGTSALGDVILQNANIITAAICASDKEEPASVCKTPAITQLVSTLGQ